MQGPLCKELCAGLRYLAAAHPEQREDEQVERVDDETGDNARRHRLSA